jgi:hypothetical protein
LSYCQYLDDEAVCALAAALPSLRHLDIGGNKVRPRACVCVSVICMVSVGDSSWHASDRKLPRRHTVLAIRRPDITVTARTEHARLEIQQHDRRDVGCAVSRAVGERGDHAETIAECGAGVMRCDVVLSNERICVCCCCCVRRRKLSTTRHRTVTASVTTPPRTHRCRRRR